MRIYHFEEIEAWKKSQIVAIKIYNLLQINVDYGFKNQIQRASVSISNNIAEGFERGSDADFRRFLFISLGSCSEVKSMMYMALQLNYVSQKDANQLQKDLVEISIMLKSFIRVLDKNGHRLN
jgi:four helix bundle protein